MLSLDGDIILLLKILYKNDLTFELLQFLESTVYFKCIAGYKNDSILMVVTIVNNKSRDNNLYHN